jgi:hypothetical protein
MSAGAFGRPPTDFVPDEAIRAGFSRTDQGPNLVRGEALFMERWP